MPKKKTDEEERRARTAKYQAGWLRENTKKYTFTLTKNQDGDMIAFLDGLDNKAGYLRQLVKGDMQRRKK